VFTVTIMFTMNLSAEIFLNSLYCGRSLLLLYQALVHSSFIWNLMIWPI